MGLIVGVETLSLCVDNWMVLLQVIHFPVFIDSFFGKVNNIDHKFILCQTLGSLLQSCLGHSH